MEREISHLVWNLNCFMHDDTEIINVHYEENRKGEMLAIRGGRQEGRVHTIRSMNVMFVIHGGSGTENSGFCSREVMIVERRASGRIGKGDYIEGKDLREKAS